MKMMNFDDAISIEIEDIYSLYREFSNKKLPDIYKKFIFGQEVIEKAENIFLETKNGKRVIDLTGGLGVANFGHNHPRIIEVRKRYNQLLRPEIHKSYLNPFLAVASNNLSNVVKFGLNYSFFCNSGAESVDGALKITYKRHNGKRKFAMHSDRSFHGKTIGAGSLSAGDNFVGGKGRFFFQKIENILMYEFNNLNSIYRQCEAVGPENVYAIFIEPYSCSTLTENSKSFLKSIRAYCTKYDISIVFDEIYSGFGKCGYDFYFHKFGISPDVLCLSKALGAGKASISAYCTTAEVFESSYGSISGALTHSTTYNSFGEECATVMEACNILLEEKISDNSKKIEDYLRYSLGLLKDEFPDIISEIRGSGTHFGIIFKDQLDLLSPLIKILPIDFTSDPLFLRKLYATSVANALWEDADILVAFTSNQEVILNISPPPIAKIEDIERYFSGISDVLKIRPFKLIMRVIKNGLVKI